MQRTKQDRSPYGLILQSTCQRKPILPSNLTDIADRNHAEGSYGLDDHRQQDETT